MGVATGEFVPTNAEVADVSAYILKSGPRTTAHELAPGALAVTASGLTIGGLPDRWLVAGAVTDDFDRQATVISGRGWAPGSRKVDYPGDSNLVLVQNNIMARGVVGVAVPGQKPFAVEASDADSGNLWDVRIHSGLYRAVDLGEIAAARIGDFLNESNPGAPERDIRLFAAPLNTPAARTVRAEYQRPEDGASDTLYGADGAALLVVNEDTLEAMRERSIYTKEELDIVRARANIVIRGLGAYVERRIKALRIGDLTLVNTGPCSRCIETGVDQLTGERDNNRFLNVLAENRQGGLSAVTGDRGLFFGFNAQPVLQDGERAVIKRRDRVDVQWADKPDVVGKKPESKE